MDSVVNSFYLCIYVCAYLSEGDQKRVSDLLELELQVVVNYRCECWELSESNKCSDPPGPLPSPAVF